MVEKVIIMGAAGRDFHNFNVYFRDNPRYDVVAFTAAQIPDIEGRLYPPELAGKAYPQGIPIYHEDSLVELIREHQIDLVAFSYSDIPHIDVMHKASLAIAEGADFILMGATYTMLKSQKPIKPELMSIVFPGFPLVTMINGTKIIIMENTTALNANTLSNKTLFIKTTYKPLSHPIHFKSHNM